MIIIIKDVLTADQCDEIIDQMAAMRFRDGRRTAGYHARLVKDNEQLDCMQSGHAVLTDKLHQAVMASPEFAIACRPRHMMRMLLSRYRDGMEYGTHIDEPFIQNIRSDVSFTLWLADPASYDGGELIMETAGLDASYKLNRGELIAYDSTRLHRVAPVTRGERICAVGWAQSKVRDPAQREILYELGTASRALFDRDGKTREFDLISKSHANLMRMWADG
jgi:PKHD-type hydroxylase